MEKKKLLLLHGALGNCTQFSSLSNLLSENYDLLYLDFEGHDGHPTEKDFSIALFSENVLEKLEQHGINKINIFGYSMGGYVALNVARTNPNLVDRIVTLGTKFHWTKEIADKEIRMLNPDKIEEKVPKFAKSLETLHQPNNWKAVVRKTAGMMFDLGNNWKLEKEDLEQINNEVLIGIGALDQMVTLEESSQAANDLANGRLSVIENFKHPIERVDMNQLAVIISNFIQ